MKPLFCVCRGLVLLLVCQAIPSFAGDGDVILTRTVQPRVATRAPLVPDPNPVKVNVSPARQIERQTGELSDADFANVSGSLGAQERMFNLDNSGVLNNGQLRHSGTSAGHSAGASSSGLGGQINRTVQQGLSPLQNLGGR